MRLIILFGLLILVAVSPPVHAQTTTDPCVPTPTSLCLNNDRFQVEVDWFTESGNSSTVRVFTGAGKARNTPISDVWTGMWFFDPDNLELMIHIFGGCSFNDNFWVFAAGLTDVEVTLTVTDTQNGEQRVFTNPLGQPFRPITDTQAFATCPRRVIKQSDQPKEAAPPRPLPTILESTTCMESATTVCLLDGRFEVSIETSGMTSPAQKLADGTAGFPFTNPTFFDMFVNIIDGRSANGQFWVTYSLFEPVAFTLAITDHVSGETKTYEHAQSDPIFVHDQQAFTGDDILTIDGTLAGSWYSQARDGEGFIFDIAVLNGVPYLVLYYFTYENNDSGRQAWVVGAAPIVGNTASVPVIIANGTRFGADFNKDDVVRTDWGHVKVTVIDCLTALIESDSPFFPRVGYELERITPSPTGVQGVCQPAPALTKGNVPAPVRTPAASHELNIDGGYSGSWFNQDRDGEGLIFNIAMINGVNTLVVFYFTYENNSSGRQAWLVGSAPIVGNSADVPMVIASGAQFGDPFNPGDVVRTPWGNVKVTWISCNLAQIEVTSVSFGDVSYEVIPLTPPTIGTTGDCAPQP